MGIALESKGLAWASLPVCEDCSIVPLDELSHQRVYLTVVVYGVWGVTGIVDHVHLDAFCIITGQFYDDFFGGGVCGDYAAGWVWRFDFDGDTDLSILYHFIEKLSCLIIHR